MSICPRMYFALFPARCRKVEQFMTVPTAFCSRDMRTSVSNVIHFGTPGSRVSNSSSADLQYVPQNIGQVQDAVFCSFLKSMPTRDCCCRVLRDIVGKSSNCLRDL